MSARECGAAGGEYALASRDAAAALKLWLPFARDGDAQAQTQVGELYERGIGAVADPAAAAEWYRRAAQQGDTRAMVNLASLLERGLGVELGKTPLSAEQQIVASLPSLDRVGFRLLSGLHLEVELAGAMVPVGGFLCETRGNLFLHLLDSDGCLEPNLIEMGFRQFLAHHYAGRGEHRLTIVEGVRR